MRVGETLLTASHPVATDRSSRDACKGHAHLIGIGGAGMRSLAAVLDADGWRISGSDIAVQSDLPSRWQVAGEHSLTPLLALPDLVIYSPAIESNNPELLAARRLALPTVSYPEMLGRLMAERTGIAVAGTHGKSTTTAMLASILRADELDPTVILGAQGPVHCSSGFGLGQHLLVEACEYRASFLHLQPKLSAILGIERDHCDYFTSQEHTESVFAQFAERVPADGVLVVPHDCTATDRAIRSAAARMVTFGFAADAEWRADIWLVHNGYYSFRVLRRGRPFAAIGLRVPGRHNVLNALAATALAFHAGVSTGAIRRGLEAFTGLSRRLETVGTVGGTTFIDDYAHHPTEIAATLATVREMHPGRPICCIFEPHQASRTKSLLDELAASLQNADTLAVADVFRAREPAWQPGDITAEDLARRARQRGARVVDVHQFDELQTWLVDAWQSRQFPPGTVVVTLGAGRIGNLVHGVYQRIRENRAG